MNTTDPIADMLTRIRNANTSKHKTVDIPASKMKTGIAEILFKEGYIKAPRLKEQAWFLPDCDEVWRIQMRVESDIKDNVSGSSDIFNRCAYVF